jgi:hypothetical protein
VKLEGIGVKRVGISMSTCLPGSTRDLSISKDERVR